MTQKPSRRVRHAMRRALAALPDPDQEIFSRARFEGHDYRHIALDLGISVADVERALVRALRALDAAANHAERQAWSRRAGRICAWLGAKLSQGWRR